MFHIRHADARVAIRNRRVRSAAFLFSPGCDEQEHINNGCMGEQNQLEPMRFRVDPRVRSAAFLFSPGCDEQEHTNNGCMGEQNQLEPIALEDLVDGEMSFKDEVAAVFDLRDRIEARRD
jgi:hypothetical protein